MKLILLLIALLCITTTPTFSQSEEVLTKWQLHKLDSIALQDVLPQGPGIAAAIIQNGEVIYQKYGGYSDLTDSTHITHQTRFNIASNGKQFTALAVLNLVDTKKLRLSDDIRKWFPKLFPKIKQDITILMLLNHTSGIRDCYDLWSLQGLTWWNKTFNNNDVLALIEKQEDLNFQPNTNYLYSNTNYILLALIIEKVSGRSFVEYTEAMFKKLNMPNTSFESDYTKIKGPLAMPYFNFSSWTTYNWIWNVCGDGNIFSTLADQIQWERLVQGTGKTTIKRSIIQQSQQVIQGSIFKNYGYGLEFSTYKGMDYTFHEGATGAWKATVLRFPDRNTSLITLTNTGKSIPYAQTRQMADVIFDNKSDEGYLVTKPTAIGYFITVDDIIGVYVTENDFAFQFEKREDKLYLKRIGRNDVELERESDNVFRQKFDSAFKQEFTRNSKDEIEVTVYHTSHQPYSLRKVSGNWANFNHQSLNGRFLNIETNVLVELIYVNENNYQVIIGNRSTNGHLISPNKLLVDNYTLRIESNDGTPNVLLLNSDRIKGVKFIRLD